ncbi:MAG: hypothetical protein NT003_00550 [Candidatus Magasanikbacteria bacterium]|nr:hypothetical protein [Candidatus Magasanikbacteria bacterium]
MENIKKILGDPLGAEVLPSAPSIQKLVSKVRFNQRMLTLAYVLGSSAVIASFVAILCANSIAGIVATGYILILAALVLSLIAYDVGAFGGAVKLTSNKTILLVFDFSSANVDKYGKFEGTRSYLFNCDVSKHRDAVLTSLTATQFGMLIETLTGQIDPLQHQQYITLHYPVLHEVTRAWLFVKTGNDGASIACEVEGKIFEVFIDPWVNKLMSMFHLRIVESVKYINLSTHYSFADAFRDWSRTPRVIELLEGLNLWKLNEACADTNGYVNAVEAMATAMEQMRKADRLADRVQFAELMSSFATNFAKTHRLALYRIERLQTPIVAMSTYVDFQMEQLRKSLQRLTTPLGLEQSPEALRAYWQQRVEELREADRAQREGVRPKRARSISQSPKTGN